jgi:hypothetical protein
MTLDVCADLFDDLGSVTHRLEKVWVSGPENGHLADA